MCPHEFGWGEVPREMNLLARSGGKDVAVAFDPDEVVRPVGAQPLFPNPIGRAFGTRFLSGRVVGTDERQEQKERQ